MHSGATQINSSNMQVGGKQVLSQDKYTGIQGYPHKRKNKRERESTSRCWEERKFTSISRACYNILIRKDTYILGRKK